MSVVLTPSWKKGKKLAALLSNDGEYITTVHFGDSAYSDYTQHKDRNRMERYIARHEPKSDIGSTKSSSGFRSEDWNYTGIFTPGFWSRWILWNKPSLVDSILDTEKRFKLKISII